MRFRAVLSLSPALPLLASIAVWLGYGRLFFTASLAAILHECGHLLAANLCCVDVRRVRFRVFGAEITLARCTRGREVLIVISGIALNLLFAALFWRPWRLFAVLHLILAAFNALPIYPLDGGRMVLLISDERKAQLVSVAFCAFLLVSAFAVSLHTSDWLPFAAAVAVSIRSALETIAFFRPLG